MAKQLNINMAFSADTSQAKKQIADLQTQLSNLMASSKANTTNTFNNEIQESIQSVAKLKMALSEATDTKTGIVDLSKFDKSLSEAGLSVEQLATNMTALGPEGVQAFSSVANSIATMESPLKRTNKLLDSFWTALKNSARWQISSSVLHGLTSAIQGAYSYAQDLNKSLTDIAIVTNQNIDQMGAFAEKANKAAQALSVTTTAYTDASLIYFQQGLSEDEVDARTETTLKMSNVTGETVDEVSSYMTAIWNNFADGSDNLELFADKITALGAATASSSEEIAEGLNQFASLGSSLGLSYDNATSALATIVAQTRQSASTVGNSLRTILQRFQNVSLGDTLEDDVDLTKYTKALKTAGVEILDVNGEMRDLNDIINDLGSAWQNLTKAQKSALAGTVAGVRNSNTLIAWMDNFDTFQDNLEVAANAEGSLQEQADIYAQSWEAARKRVKAAWQAIYSDIIDDDFFITLNNALADTLQLIDKLIDGFGGLPNLLIAIGTVFTSVFGDKISSGLNDMVYSLSMMTSAGQKKQQEKDENIRNEWAKNNEKILGNSSYTGGSYETEARIENLKNEQKLMDEYNKKLDLMTDKQKTLNKLSIELYKANGKNVEQLGREVDEEEKKLELIKKEIMQNSKTGDTKKDTNRQTLKIAGEKIEEKYKEFQEAIQEANDNPNLTNEAKEGIISAAYDEYETKLNIIATNVAKGNTKLNNGLVSYGRQLDVVSEKTKQFNEAQKNQEEVGKKVEENFEDQSKSALNYGEAILAAASMIGGVVTIINSLKSAFTVISDPDASGWEKFGAIITTVGVTLGTLATAFNSTNIELVKTLVKTLALAAGNVGLAATEEGATVATIGFGTALKALIPGFLEIIAVIGTVVGILYVLDNSIETFADKTKKAKEELSEANTALEEATTAAEEASSAYDSLSTALENLDSDPLEGLTEGTIEWKNAISDANDELLTALDNAGVLGKAKLSYDKNGLLQVSNSEELKESAYQNKEDKLIEKYAAAAVKAEKAQEVSTLTAATSIKDALEPLTKGHAQIVDGQLTTYVPNEKISNTYSKTETEIAEILEDNLSKYLAEGGVALSAKELANYSGNNEYINELLNQFGTETSILETIASLLESMSEGQGTEEENLIQIGEAYLEKQEIDTSSLSDSQRRKLALEAGTNIKSQAEDIVGNWDLDTKKEMFAAQKGYTLVNGKIWDTENDKEIDVDEDYITNQLIALIQDDLIKGAIEGLNLEEDKEILTEKIANAEKASHREAYGGLVGTLQGTNSNISTQDIYSFSESTNDDGSYKYSTQELEDFNEWLEKTDENTLKTANSIEDLYALFEHSQEEGLDATKLDEDIDEDEWANLVEYLQDYADTIDGLSEDLKNCKAEAQRAAQAFLRFDDAVQDVNDNYEDWNDALESGNVQDLSKALIEMRDAYGDLLDIDGNELSDDFINDKNNLDLMKQAIEGNEEAYNQLALNAGEGIWIKAGLDDTDFWNTYNELQSLDYLTSGEFARLEAGAAIDDSSFINTLNNMLLAARDSEVQAQQIFDAMGQAMGFDGEIEQYEVDNPYESTGITAEPIETKGITSEINATDSEGKTISGGSVHIPGWTYKKTEDTSSGSDKQVYTAYRVKSGSLHKSYGGSIKYNNSSNASGNGKKNSGSGNKGSGGSKAGSKKQHKEAKDSAKEKDRYHNIKEKIEDVTDSLDKLNDASDRAWGKPKLKLMDQAIAKQKEQISLTDEYIKEIKQYAKTDKDNLIQVMKDLGMTEQEIASQFGEDGVLKDYEGLLDRIQSKFDETGTNIYNSVLARYNAAVDAYNAGDRTDSSAVDALSEELEAAEETYNNRKDIFDKQKEYLEQYEDTINLLQEKEAERIELLNELYDSQLSQLTTKIELQVSLNEDELDQAEWYLDALGDKADKAADRIASLNKQLEINQKNIELNKNALKEIFSLHGVNVDIDNLNGNNLAEALTNAINRMQTSGMTVDMDTVIDQIAGYRDNLRDAYDNIVDIQEEITDNVIDAYDEWNEKLEDNLDLIDHYDTVIDSYKEIADLLGTDVLGLGDTVAIQYEQAKLKNYQDAAAAAKDSFDAIHEQLIKAQAQLANATSEAEKEHWQEVVDEVAEMERDAEEEYLSRWQSALEQAEEMYKNSIERNTNAYKKALGSGSSTLDNLQEEIDRQKTINDLHLEDYQKYKRLGDLSASINQSLAKNPNVKIQQKLNSLLDDVNSKMADGVEISEGEATILEKRLALLQAEDQLQAARNSKSAVRLTRDNEGNFSYTYTADTSAIEDAQQNYADKFNELLDYEKEYSEQVQDSMLDAWQNFIDKRNNILEDDMLSESERNEALAKLKSDYEKIVSTYTDELEMITTEMSRLKTEDWKDIEQTIGRILASDSDFETSFDQTMLGKMVNADWATAADLMKAWQQAADECYSADAEAYNKWKENNEATNNAVDTSTSQVSEKYVSNMNKMAESSDKVAESTKNMAEQMNSSMDDILANADNFFTKYGNYLDELLTKINSITSALNNMEVKMADVGYTTTGDTQVVKAQSFDTGGYTGSWGSTGKLAVLHQKEMVLNQNDTSNLLSTIGLVKEIVGNFSNNFIDAAGRLNYSGLSSVGSGSLDQNVQIQANFPNVVDHNEIELALNNLVNSASQYVNKK